MGNHSLRTSTKNLHLEHGALRHVIIYIYNIPFDSDCVFVAFEIYWVDAISTDMNNEGQR